MKRELSTGGKDYEKEAERKRLKGGDTLEHCLYLLESKAAAPFFSHSFHPFVSALPLLLSAVREPFHSDYSTVEWSSHQHRYD